MTLSFFTKTENPFLEANLKLYVFKKWCHMIMEICYILQGFENASLQHASSVHNICVIKRLLCITSEV